MDAVVRFNEKAVFSQCDLVGVPDMASGAMENWGLITFRETALLDNAVRQN